MEKKVDKNIEWFIEVDKFTSSKANNLNTKTDRTQLIIPKVMQKKSKKWHVAKRYIGILVNFGHHSTTFQNLFLENSHIRKEY